MIRHDDHKGIFNGKGRKYISISLVCHIVIFIVLLSLSFPHIRIKRLRDIKPIKVYAVDMPQKAEQTTTPRQTPAPSKPEIKSTPRPKPESTPKPRKTISKPTPKKEVTPKPTPQKTQSKKTPKPTPRPTNKPEKTSRPTPVPRKTPSYRSQPTPRPSKPVSTPMPQPRSTPSTPAVSSQQGPLKVQASDLPGYYLESVKRRIESNFEVPQHLKNTPAQCTIQFTIFKDGTMNSVLVVKSTGSKLMDQLAVQAIEKTGQLGPLPDTYLKNSIIVMLTFDFSV